MKERGEGAFILHLANTTRMKGATQGNGVLLEKAK